MSKKEQILDYCTSRDCEVTAKEIVSALYPKKHQSFINSEIAQLVDEGRLVRNDNVKPYIVGLTKINEKNNYYIPLCKLPIDDAVQYIKDYYNETLYDRNGCHMSWQHCYNAFKEQHKKKDSVTIDLLCLHLAFYLASMGVFRSSFLLHKDYKAHKPIVDIILNDRYESLWGISAGDLQQEKNMDLVFELSDKIRVGYARQTPAIIGKENNATDILITSILLGTFGCVPVFDRNLMIRLKEYGCPRLSYCKFPLLFLTEYYLKNEDTFEKFRNNFNQCGIIYPPMKLLDMCLWQAGNKKIVWPST